MSQQQKKLDVFFKALTQAREARQRELLENEEKEQARLKWIAFQQVIEAEWVPIIGEYLNVLGELWFGHEMRLKGPMFRKELVPIPSYIVTHEVFGPMAIFWVAEKVWQEREVSVEGTTEFKTELIRHGFRCRIVMKDDGQYQFQDDGHNILIQFEDQAKISWEELDNIFASAYSEGPTVIFYRWKDALVGIDGSDLTYSE